MKFDCLTALWFSLFFLKKIFVLEFAACSNDLVKVDIYIGVYMKVSICNICIYKNNPPLSWWKLENWFWFSG